MHFYQMLFVAVTGLVLGILLGGMLLVYMLHCNEKYIRNRERKRNEKNRLNRKKQAKKMEIKREKKAKKKVLKDKLTNQDFTYADLMDSVDEESTEAETIQSYRKMQDRSYGIIQTR